MFRVELIMIIIMMIMLLLLLLLLLSFSWLARPGKLLGLLSLWPAKPGIWLEPL